MYAGNPPFEKAAPNDPYYKLIKERILQLSGRLIQEEDQLDFSQIPSEICFRKWLLSILNKGQKLKK